MDPSRSNSSTTSRRFSGTEWIALLSLTAVQFANILDFVIVMPLGPRYINQFGITPELFGRMVAVYGFTAFVGGVIAAGFIDRFERKRTLLALFACFAVSTWVCSWAPDYRLLVMARGLTGIFGGILGSMVMTIVSELFEEANRGFAIGIVTISFSIASVLGIPAGLWLADHFNAASAPFFVLSIACLIIWCILLLTLPTMKSHLRGPRRSYIETVVATLKVPRHLLAFVFMMAIVFSSFTVAPYTATYCVANVGLRQDELKYIYIVGGLATLISMPLIGRLSDRFGKFAVFQIVILIGIIPTAIMTNLTSVPLPIALAVTTFYMVMTSGRMVPAQALIASAAAPEQRAGFMSINTAIQHLACGLAASLTASIVGENELKQITNYQFAGYIAIGCMVLSIFLGWQLDRMSRSAKSTSIAPLTSLEANTLKPVAITEPESVAL